MIPFKEEKYMVKICFVCSTKIGPNNLMTKNSCFICGQYVFINRQKKIAYRCLKHQGHLNFTNQKNVIFQCGNCNQMSTGSNEVEVLKPQPAQLCTMCADFKCCNFE